MYCPKCKEENKDNAKFCEYCGAKIEFNKSEIPKKTTKTSLNQVAKILIGCLCVLIIFLVLFIFLQNNSKPAKVAEKYFLALINNDADKIYDYLKVEDVGFTSRDIFLSVYKENDNQKLLNYSIVNEKTSGLTSTVTIEYTLKDNPSLNNIEINLIKDKNNKLLIFDNWKVSDIPVKTLTNYQITSLKGSTLTLDGIVLDDNYLDAEQSLVSDTYVIPELFAGTYDAKLVLDSGLIFKGKVSLNSIKYEQIIFDLSITNEEKEQLTTELKSTIEQLYLAIIKNKSFSDIKDNFYFTSDEEVNKMEEDYNSFASRVSSGLTELTVDDITILSTKLNYSGTFSVMAEVDYSYCLSYAENGEEKTKNGTTSSTLNLFVYYSNGQYKIESVPSMPTYFSRS